jgi:hypothetical protein
VPSLSLHQENFGLSARLLRSVANAMLREVEGLETLGWRGRRAGEVTLFHVHGRR